MTDRRATGRAVTAWLSHTDHRRAQRLAQRYGLSVSALACMALLDLLDEEDPTADQADRELLLAKFRTKH